MQKRITQSCLQKIETIPSVQPKDPWVSSKIRERFTLVGGGATLSSNVSFIKKVIPSARNPEPTRRPTKRGSIPRHGDITLRNKEHVGRPFWEHHVPNYVDNLVLMSADCLEGGQWQKILVEAMMMVWVDLLCRDSLPEVLLVIPCNI